MSASTAVPASADSLLPHNDALLGQWRRTQQLRDFPTLRTLAASKGLEVIKSASIAGATYKVYSGKGSTRKLELHGNLTEVGQYLDSRP